MCLLVVWRKNSCLLKVKVSMKHHIIISLLLFFQTFSLAQSEPPGSWDNQLYIGNKIAGGKNDWRFSGELQVRLKDNTQSLDNYFIEGVATYLIKESWEIAPDIRMSIKPDEFELRPGFSLVYKFLGENIQLVNQLKWQIDIDGKGNADNAMRYVVFLNYKASKKLIPNLVAGGFYRWKEDFTGFQYFRFGPGLAFIMDVKHVLNINYLFSASNTGVNWSWAGIPFIQLVININKEFKYLPAKYYNF